MTQEEILDQIINDENIEYAEVYFEVMRGRYWKDAQGEVILINSEISTSAERVFVKAHELGHHFSGVEPGRDEISVSRSEHRANRWALEWIMPIERLIEACEAGVRRTLELADYVGIPIEELCKGLDMYYGIYGPRSIHGQYVIDWNPFRIKKDKRRKQGK